MKGGSEISVLMIVGSIRLYKFDRYDRLLTPIRPIRPELTDKMLLEMLIREMLEMLYVIVGTISSFL